jgi:hypothetical protein
MSLSAHRRNVNHRLWRPPVGGISSWVKDSNEEFEAPNASAAPDNGSREKGPTQKERDRAGRKSAFGMGQSLL